jgi:hypothetical protein
MPFMRISHGSVNADAAPATVSESGCSRKSLYFEPLYFGMGRRCIGRYSDRPLVSPETGLYVHVARAAGTQTVRACLSRIVSFPSSCSAHLS